jgi:hypothetical protein
VRARERATDATIVVVASVVIAGTSTSFDDARGEDDAETTREDDRDRALAFGARTRVGAIVANGMTTSDE